MKTYSGFLKSKGEERWQQYWDKNKTFLARENSKKKKFYGLIEFPYPSGDGLHTGHLRSNTAMDVICRYQRMMGREVLYPIGFDSFGLPAENYAVKKGIAPQITTQANIKTFTRQLKSSGFSFDWSRAFSTTDEDYYRWTQWIFIQLFKQGLAYKAKENINWCTVCQIGLANEEVVNGVCERCGGQVVKKEKAQWMLKITKYADRLIKGLDKVDFLPQIKQQQINWIGRSEGADVIFKVRSRKSKVGSELKVFTTRPDTLFGATFMAVAPEHELLVKFKNEISNWSEVEKYIKQAQGKSDLERTDLAKNKTGVELKGLKAINPVNNEELPIFVADYILSSYGYGAIMAVPAHDERDFAFAQKYKLPIREVIAPLFKVTEGSQVIRQGEKIVKRKNVYVFVKHWSENKYICLDWKKIGWHSAVVGGIKDGESSVQAAVREVKEETGYQNIKIIKELNDEIHSQGYLPHKNVNRHAIGYAVLVRLKNDKHLKTKKEDTKNHDVVWIKADEVMGFLNLDNNKLMWQRLTGDHVCYSGEGVAKNSKKFNGLETSEFKKKIIQWLAKNKVGTKQINYKLRDWIFSRQRYWGEPIPMIHCDKCQWQPVPVKDLPVKLPKIKDFMPTKSGDSPLAKVNSFIKTKCPKCGGPARRETDVMPNWAGSNWYFIRYTDPKNKKILANPSQIKYWLPVDWYNGGMEHVTLHLLYSRFVFKFLYDIKIIPKEVGDEPYQKRTAHGIILGKGGVKMSKSKGNVINPDDYTKKFGADTLRLYEMFMGPFDQTIVWDDKGVIGVNRFLNKVWSLQFKVKNSQTKVNEIETLLHQTVKKVGDDIMHMKFNTAVSQLMILVNKFETQSGISKAVWEKFVLIMAPFAPHLAEELWQQLGNKKSLSYESWPKYDQKLAQEKDITLAIQINGKVRDKIELPFNAVDSKKIKDQVLALDRVQKLVDNKKIKKYIHIKNRIISIVV